VRRFKPGSELGFAAGGSGTLVKTDDGGRSWKRDRSTDEVAGNLYAIKWTKVGRPTSPMGSVLFPKYTKTKLQPCYIVAVDLDAIKWAFAGRAHSPQVLFFQVVEGHRTMNGLRQRTGMFASVTQLSVIFDMGM